MENRKKLTLASFIDPEADSESHQYRIQSALNGRYYAAFRQNRIYPELGELASLCQRFAEIIEARDSIETRMPRRLVGADPNERRLVFEMLAQCGDGVARVFDLIEWAIPVIERAIREGAALFDFVEERIATNVVGIVPIWRNEGYWAVPAHGDPEPSLRVYAYNYFTHTTSGDRVFAISTREVDRRPLGGIIEPPEAIKTDYVRRNPNLPNPAFFLSETDLAFPFAETIFPVAKRKFMRALAA